MVSPALEQLARDLAGQVKLVTGQRRADSLLCGVAPLDTLPGRVIGARPSAVCRWIFTLLGAGPGDTLEDLFPGTGHPHAAAATSTAASRCASARSGRALTVSAGPPFLAFGQDGEGGEELSERRITGSQVPLDGAQRPPRA
jgi:hypothetical protein